jgi:lambda repressor-like predicted transcriptional regulator
MKEPGKIIKQLLIERGMPVKDLAVKIGIIPQTLSNKMSRNIFSYQEFVQIADILETDVKVVTRDTNKEFS